MTAAKTRRPVTSASSPSPSPSSRALLKTRRGPAVNLSQYAPAFFTFIANKWSSGSSSHYLSTYGVGIETWRVLVMLALEERLTAQGVVQMIGMDKASVSRTFKSMHERGLLAFSADAKDGRLRHATLTPAGRALHDRILRLAMVREQALLSVLSPQEVDLLLNLLQRLHANLPAVEAASEAFVAQERPVRPARAAKPAPAKRR